MASLRSGKSLNVPDSLDPSDNADHSDQSSSVSDDSTTPTGSEALFSDPPREDQGSPQRFGGYSPIPDGQPQPTLDMSQLLSGASNALSQASSDVIPPTPDQLAANQDQANSSDPPSVTANFYGSSAGNPGDGNTTPPFTAPGGTLHSFASNNNTSNPNDTSVMHMSVPLTPWQPPSTAPGTSGMTSAQQALTTSQSQYHTTPLVNHGPAPDLSTLGGGNIDPSQQAPSYGQFSPSQAYAPTIPLMPPDPNLGASSSGIIPPMSSAYQPPDSNAMAPTQAYVTTQTNAQAGPTPIYANAVNESIRDKPAKMTPIETF